MAPASNRIRASRRRLDLRPRTAGQALVEFALIVPVLAVLFLTVLDLGRLFYSQIALNNAAREGAFQASKTPTSYQATHPWVIGNNPCDVNADAVTCRALLEFASTQQRWYVFPTANDVTLTCNPSCAPAMGNLATVTVNGNFSLWTVWMAFLLGHGQNLTLTASSTSQIEKFPPPGSALPTPTPTPTPTASASAAPTPTPTPQPCSVPSAGFTISPASGTGPSPLTVTFTDTSTPIASSSCPITAWLWNFDDHSTYGGQFPPAHVFLRQNQNFDGVYNVTLKVTNSAGSNTSAARTITATH